MHSALPDPLTQAGFYDDIPLKRFLAWLVDGILIFALCLMVLPFTGFLGLFVWPLFWLTLGFVYRWTTLARGSSTWGMRLLAIEFRDRHGQHLDTGTAFMLALVYTISLGTFALQALSVALILISPRRQSLGDHLLGTAAINRPAGH